MMAVQAVMSGLSKPEMIFVGLTLCCRVHTKASSVLVFGGILLYESGAARETSRIWKQSLVYDNPFSGPVMRTSASGLCSCTSLSNAVHSSQIVTLTTM